MINEVLIKKEIVEYFEYIKEVYLISFDKILNDKTKEKIKNITSDIIEIDLDSEFRIKIRENIRFCLNINKFVKNNNFDNDNFKDIDESGLKKINYFLDNKENILKLAKDSLLDNIILYFLDNKNMDVITLGTINLIANYIAKKYNLITLDSYKKESEVVNHLIDFIGEKSVYKSILNNEIDSLKNAYNKYIISLNNEDSFESITRDLNKIYSNYGKNKDKVYYADSLYYYQKIDYNNIIKKIDEVKNQKQKSIDIMYSRLNSIIDCMQELDRYKIISSNEEKVTLYYATLNLKRIISKINEDQNIDKYYDELITLENEIRPLVSKIWVYYLANELDYNNDEQHWFLVENLNNGYKKDENKFVLANLITNDNVLLPTDDVRYQYGFIYNIKTKSIIYSAPDNISYKEFKKTKDYKENINTIVNDQKILEIEEQYYSTLMTPRNLLIKTLKNDKKYNNVLLDKETSDIIGIYAITDGNDDNISYKKAKDLADKFELPLIPIIKK